METKKSVKNMTYGNSMKFRPQWDYLSKEPHINNEKNWRLKCLKIPI
ncbi:MAG: hypothetical protein PVG39_23520 [Desulfobacteraceae bacterium]|jgi:hypothetical protein